MNVDIISEMRKLMANRAKNMNSVDIDTQSLDITKEDLYSELRATDTEITDSQISAAIDEADKKGYIELITPDIVSFKRDFIN